MGADPESYAVLGLPPGADLAAVERAYKQLIKAYHPDRSGGDPKRAAELNRAYRELRAALGQRSDVSLFRLPPIEATGWSPTLWALALLIVLGASAVAISLAGARRTAEIVGIKQDAAARTVRSDIMEQPLDLAAIDSAALEAVKMSKVADEMALSAHSNRCFQQFRSDPAMSNFDRCAAFDSAVVRIQDRDPLRDRGRFSEIAVTSRLWSAASQLSSDYVATDARLRRLRLHVELLLAPAEPNLADR